MARRFQFSLRDIFRWTLYVCLAIGTWMAYGRLVVNAQRDAIEQAILAGRLKPEDR